MNRYEADLENGLIRTAGEEAFSGNGTVIPKARILMLPPPADDCLMTLCYETSAADGPPVFSLVFEPSGF
jgi:hypothetical protein